MTPRFRLRALLAAALLATSTVAANAATLLERVRAGDTITVGTANESPFSAIGPDGELVGSDIALLRAVLAEMGTTKLKGTLTEFGALIPGLRAGRFDIIAAGLYISPERCRAVSFAEPVFAIGNTVIVPAGNPKKLNGFAALSADPSIRIGHTAGSRLRGDALLFGIKESQLSAFPDAPALIAAVKSGRIDAALFPALSAQTLLDRAQDPAVERAIPFETPLVDGRKRLSYGSFAVTGNEDFLKVFNEHLTRIVQSPRYAEMVRPFGFTPEDLPTGEVTTASLCGR